MLAIVDFKDMDLQVDSSMIGVPVMIKGDIILVGMIDECVIQCSASCEGCSHQPKDGDNFPFYCVDCSRFYTDKYVPRRK
jgi:hypothetical protein